MSGRNLVEDALAEMENMGAGSVAERISRLFCSRVSHQVPRTGVVETKDLGRVLSPPGTMGVCVFCPVKIEKEGQYATGNIMMFMDQEDASVLVKALGSPIEPHPLDKTDQERLSRFADLVFSVFLESVSGFFGFAVERGIARVAPLMGEGLVDLLTISSREKENMVIQTTLSIDSIECSFTLVLQASASSIERLLTGVIGGNE